jgi:transforming growth factor-beta-induced protein
MYMERITGICISMLVVACLLVAGCTQPVTSPVTPATTATAPITATPTAPMTPLAKNIVETAVADGRFTTLVAAVQAANLTGTLSGPGPFTVFAPTDEAFRKLPAGTVETLLKDPQGQLKEILLYHVVPGKLMAADIQQVNVLKTVQGGNLTVSTVNGSVMIDDAKVITANINTSNGEIHVIDMILIPS